MDTFKQPKKLIQASLISLSLSLTALAADTPAYWSYGFSNAPMFQTAIEACTWGSKNAGVQVNEIRAVQSDKRTYRCERLIYLDPPLNTRSMWQGYASSSIITQVSEKTYSFFTPLTSFTQY